MSLYLQFADLSKQFGYNFAVKNASGSLQAGDYIALLGPNGAGKSTLLYLLSGIYHPHQGRITFPDGGNFTSFYSKMQLISHLSMLYPRLTAEENLLFFNKISPLQSELSPAEVLEICGLSKARHLTLEGFSRGMLQRIALARAIMARPEIVFLDEPFTGLDLKGQNLLLQILRNKGMAEIGWKIRSFVMVDHDLHRVYDLSEKIWLVEKGSLASPLAKDEISFSALEARLA